MAETAGHVMLPPDLRVLERGWLSSNSLVMLGDPRGAVVVDTGYCTHKDQTLALLRQTLGPSGKLRLIVNTHLHSDHCGGNAQLAAAFDSPIWIPPGHFQAVQDWDEGQLGYPEAGQHCERFTPQRALQPGEVIEQTGRHWQVHAAPGHDPHSVVLFEPESGVLLSADALWERGFGIVFPEIEGQAGEGFTEVAATLDLIESLRVQIVVPGHGPAFHDVASALARARERLAYFRQNPDRHARYAAKALIKYHLLEVGSRPRAALLKWLADTPIHNKIWKTYFRSQSIDSWSGEMLEELAQTKAIRMDPETVFNL